MRPFTHVLTAKNEPNGLSRAQLDCLIAKAYRIKSCLEGNFWVDGGPTYANALWYSKQLTGRIMASVFDQPSLRTSSSHEAAMYSLGGNVISYRNLSRETSIAKDESLGDTMEMLTGNPGVSVAVLRHPEAGAAQRAARASSVPLINAGDGLEHPTQAMLDLFTIHEVLGGIDGKNIAIVGDLAARTVRSLLFALTLCRDIHVTFVRPPEQSSGLPSDVLQYLACSRKICFRYEENLVRAARTSAVIYVVRPQQENWEKQEGDEQRRKEKIQTRLANYYACCTVDMSIVSQMHKDAIVLHPRPRGPELPAEVDGDPRVRHVQQGRNGGIVRMALLSMLHTGEWQELATPA